MAVLKMALPVLVWISKAMPEIYLSTMRKCGVFRSKHN